jgi:excinuclease UvrABC nuclease subunit
MIYSYKGHYQYNKLSISNNAPDEIGVYYCGSLNKNGELIPYYIGRALGENVTIKSRLLDHFRHDYWSDVTYFGFQVCTTTKEVESFEKTQIEKYKPKYNKQNIKNFFYQENKNI